MLYVRIYTSQLGAVKLRTLHIMVLNDNGVTNCHGPAASLQWSVSVCDSFPALFTTYSNALLKINSCVKST